MLRIGRVISLLRAEDDEEPQRVSTDAPLISGDSGGPIFDLNGRVIGINSMITSAGRRMARIHVPVTLAKSAIAAARKGEKPESWRGPSREFSDAMQAATVALQNREPLGQRLHHSVLDAVVYHHHEVHRSHRAAQQPALVRPGRE